MASPIQIPEAVQPVETAESPLLKRLTRVLVATKAAIPDFVLPTGIKIENHMHGINFIFPPDAYSSYLGDGYLNILFNKGGEKEEDSIDFQYFDHNPAEESEISDIPSPNNITAYSVFEGRVKSIIQGLVETIIDKRIETIKLPVETWQALLEQELESINEDLSTNTNTHINTGIPQPYKEISITRQLGGHTIEFKLPILLNGSHNTTLAISPLGTQFQLPMIRRDIESYADISQAEYDAVERNFSIEPKQDITNEQLLREFMKHLRIIRKALQNQPLHTTVTKAA